MYLTNLLLMYVFGALNNAFTVFFLSFCFLLVSGRGAWVSAACGVGAGQDRWYDNEQQKHERRATPHGQGLVVHLSKDHP